MFRPFTGSHVLHNLFACKSRITNEFNKVSIRTARRMTVRIIHGTTQPPGHQRHKRLHRNAPLVEIKSSYGAHQKNLNEDRPISYGKM